MRSSKYWYLLLLVAPFVNIVNFRIGEVAGLLMMILPLTLFVFTAKKRNSFNHYEKSVYKLLICSLLVIIIGFSFSLVYSIDNFYYYRFFCLSFILFPAFFFCGDSELFIKTNLLFFLKYYIVLISGSILIGTILKSVGMDHLEPMYDVEKWSYLNRPFGIFGQPSVNSSLLCFFYIFHRAAAKLWLNKYLKGKDWLFWIVTVGVVLQGSGSGFLSYVLVLLCKFSGNRYNIPWLRILLISIVGLLGLYEVVISGVVDKISLDYINFLIDFVSEDLIDPYKKMIKNDAYLLWGVPDFPLSIDLGPLYMLGTIGLIVTLFIFVFLFYMFRQTRSLDMKIGFIMLIVGNLHYPVMFYMIMHFMWYIIIYYVLVIEKTSQGSIKEVKLVN